MFVARINWNDGVLIEEGTLRHVSRFGTPPTPAGRWDLRDSEAEKHDALEVNFALATGESREFDLVGGTLKNVIGGELRLTRVKGVELILTPAEGVAVTSLNVIDNTIEVRDRFANLDRGAGWSASIPLAVKNVGTVPASCWLRVIGVK